MRKNKLFILGMLALSLMIGLILAGCDDGGAPDTWSDVTSLEQLHGTWKGSYSEAMPIGEMIGSDFNDEMATVFGDMKASVSGEATITIDATA
ncbi:MAG: hypothetical protein LBG43_08595 [Treponema sp.]|jgi:hypothetical protein|nr:hypothetical protein [Treponema sp.]